MKHTAAYMVPAIGQTIHVRTDNWTIPMNVLDVKSVYGNIRLEVTPINGIGRAWIELSRVVVPSAERQIANCYV